MSQEVNKTDLALGVLNDFDFQVFDPSSTALYDLTGLTAATWVAREYDTGPAVFSQALDITDAAQGVVKLRGYLPSVAILPGRYVSDIKLQFGANSRITERILVDAYKTVA